MKKRKALSVQPLRKYSKPIYPSYLDKNPLEYPETIPYPFSQKALKALVAAGILVGIPQLTSCDLPKASAAVSFELPFTAKDTLGNPFPFESMGVPYIPASFGTGLPSRIKSEDAREVINKVFKEEGLKLEQQYMYNKDGVKVLLDGYNPELQIGYVWVDYRNMGPGMVASYNRRYPSNDSYARYTTSPLNDIENYDMDALDRTINRFLERIEDFDEEKKTITKALEEARQISRKKKQRKAFEALYLDTKLLQAKAYKNSIVKTFIDQGLKDQSVENKEKVLIETMLYQAVENYTQNYSRTSEGNQELIVLKVVRNHGYSILKLNDEKKRKTQFNILLHFLQIQKPSFHYSSKSPLIEEYNRINKIENKEEFLRAAEIFIDQVDGPKLSLDEAKKLESLGESQRDFIAPISQRDQRFAYRIRGLSEDQMEKLEELRENGSKEAYRVARRKAYQDARLISRNEVLKNLEEQVRQYIEWAKHQY